MENRELNWVVLGCGVIANEMAQGLQKMGKKLYGVANRTHTKAIDFAHKYNVEKVYDTIDELFEDKDVDIVYITTPHNTHYQYMKKALEHGKHIFVEKSITLNSKELEEMITTFFKILENNNIKSFKELKKLKWNQIVNLINEVNDIDEDTKKLYYEALKELILIKESR